MPITSIFPHVPRTPGWDTTVLEHSTPWTVVYGNDLFQGPNIPTAVFIGTGLIRELGYFNPPGCDDLFLDNAWKLYGEYLGTLVYLPDVGIEYVHYLLRKAAEDDLYREFGSLDEVLAAFERYFLARSIARAKGDLAEVSRCTGLDAQRLRERLRTLGLG